MSFLEIFFSFYYYSKAIIALDFILGDSEIMPSTLAAYLVLKMVFDQLP
jgi:hypothetical protein